MAILVLAMSWLSPTSEASAATLAPDGDYGAAGVGVVPSPGAADRFEAMADAVADGKRIVVAGNTGPIADETVSCAQVIVGRLDANGKPDISFGVGGIFTSDLGMRASCARSMAVDRKHRVLVVLHLVISKTRRSTMLIRLTADGRLDSGFGMGGRVWLDRRYGEGTVNPTDLALLGGLRPQLIRATGRGRDWTTRVIRLDERGRIARDLRPFGRRMLTSDASGVDSRGRTYIVTVSSRISSKSQFAVWRLRKDGHIDRSYGKRSKASPCPVPKGYKKPFSALTDMVVTGAGRVWLECQVESTGAGSFFGNALLDRNGKLLRARAFNLPRAYLSSLAGPADSLWFAGSQEDPIVSPGLTRLFPLRKNGTLGDPTNEVAITPSLRHVQFVLGDDGRTLFAAGHIAAPEYTDPENLGYTGVRFGRLAITRLSLSQ